MYISKENVVFSTFFRKLMWGTAMATKNNKRTVITKLLLKNSLMELMKEKSINKITIKEICEQAELNRSTFYLHYQDQYELLNDIENEIIEKTFEYLKNVDSKLDTIESLETFLDYIKTNDVAFQILLCQSENSSFQELLVETAAGYVKLNVPELSDANNEKYIYVFLMQGCLHLLKEWINSGFDIPTKEIAELIFKLCNNVAKC